MNNGIAAINYKVQNVWMKNTTYIEAVYSGTTKFHDSSINATNILNITKGIVTLTLEKKGIIINTDSIKTADGKTTIKATITDETGELLVSITKLAFKTNGKTILNNVTSNKGKIDISFDNTLKSGLYELLIISGENGIYKSGKMTTVLKV